MGLASKIERRLRWYRNRFRVNNPTVGRVIETIGRNIVRMDGLRFSVDAPQITTGHKSTLAFGLHEMEERELAKRWVPKGIPVIELGGGLGVVSCLVNRRLENPSLHIVVEANPEMVPVLSRNRDLNGCKFSIVNKAVAYGTDRVRFDIHGDFVASSATAMEFETAKTIEVEAVTIGQIMADFGISEAGIIADIEGAEADIIRKELPALGSKVRYILAEMHPRILGDEMVRNLLSDLEFQGFRHRESKGDTVFYSRD